MDAQLFSYTGDNIGFNPKYPQPPNYIKVRAKFKKEREFDRVFLAQDLRPALKRKRGSIDGERTRGALYVSNCTDPDAIWALEFSQDGKYLAAGGQDKVIRVWAVISTSEERRSHEKKEEEAVGDSKAERLSAPVFQQGVYRQYTGHESAVIDLNWSKVRAATPPIRLVLTISQEQLPPLLLTRQIRPPLAPLSPGMPLRFQTHRARPLPKIPPSRRPLLPCRQPRLQTAVMVHPR